MCLHYNVFIWRQIGSKIPRHIVHLTRQTQCATQSGKRNVALRVAHSSREDLGDSERHVLCLQGLYPLGHRTIYPEQPAQFCALSSWCNLLEESTTSQTGLWMDEKNLMSSECLHSKMLRMCAMFSGVCSHSKTKVNAHIVPANRTNDSAHL